MLAIEEILAAPHVRLTVRSPVQIRPLQPDCEKGNPTSKAYGRDDHRRGRSDCRNVWHHAIRPRRPDQAGRIERFARGEYDLLKAVPAFLAYRTKQAEAAQSAPVRSFKERQAGLYAVRVGGMPFCWYADGK